uniref:Putative secreted protein n=1 Tax=Anopheles darlingi TaxID=43151 RepID=A0A2M4DR69_ANODA
MLLAALTPSRCLALVPEKAICSQHFRLIEYMKTNNKMPTNQSGRGKRINKPRVPNNTANHTEIQVFTGTLRRVVVY